MGEKLKKIDFGKTVGILANIGVVAGIIFLAFELRQNNQILIAQASYAQFVVERDRRNRLIENVGGITDLLEKSRAGIPLEADESFRLGLLWEDLIDSWRWQYREVEAGRLPNDFFDVRTARAIWQANPALVSYFLDRRQSRYDPEFVEWMEENVVNER